MTIYHVRIRGQLDPHWREWLGDMRMSHAPDGTSVLTGALPDQAALYGVLGTLQDLGVQLVSVVAAEEDEESGAIR